MARVLIINDSFIGKAGRGAKTTQEPCVSVVYLDDDKGIAVEPVRAPELESGYD